MTQDLVLTRQFAIDEGFLFSLITEKPHLLQWWGPEGVHIGDNDLDLTRCGPWMSVMVNGDGSTHQVSWTVLTIDPPERVSLTWGWHDQATGERGHESHVLFQIVPEENDGCLLMMTQIGLPTNESLGLHREGWTSSLARIDALI